ncbi:response regulator [Butyrivibrio sp. VCD2006]|uniref:response regulator n=1 Tax=Butyrivibrio sp. VCD2006 TaxID=1280664 RepID=UPI0006868225|nr:response regulator [Butyrivibrio sp. VCD2006]
MYYSSFGILSLVLFIVLNHEIIFKKKGTELSTAKNKYRYFLFSVILYLISDIAWGLLYERHLIAAVYVDTVIYFLTMVLSVMLWTDFVVEYLNNKNLISLIFKHFGRIMFLSVAVGLAINLFVPVWFVMDSDGNYEPLPFRYLFLGAQVLLFAFTAIYTFIIGLRSSEKVRQHHFTIAISGTTMTVFIVLQTIEPLFPFYAIGCLLAGTFIHTFLSVEMEHDRNRLLEDALEAAEGANAAKSVFLLGMSHEIRTPINTMLGMNQIIRRDCKDKEILSCTDSIEDAGNRLLKIITDILDYTKIESGELEIINENYFVPDMMGEIYSLIYTHAKEKGLKLTFEIDPRMPQRLYGDTLKIKQVLTNLLNNAVKFTDKGNVVFRVTLIEEEVEHARLRFVVIDTGIGIKKDDLDKLFHAFNRVDTEHTCSIEGTGLGLTIASNILQLMGTKLLVDSTYKSGSTFYFDIIQKVADPTPIGTEWEREYLRDNSNEKGNLSFTSPESRILIVDDTELNIKVICGLLKPLQMQIDTASSGEECLEKFSSVNYDVVFLDYLMPEMDGIQTLEKMRVQCPAKTASTPIISLTASAVAGVREKMMEAGFTDFMTKPVILQDMLKLLRKYLPKSHIHNVQQETKQSDVLTAIPKKLLDIPWINIEEAVEYCGSPQLFLGAIKILTGGIDEKAKLLEDCLSRDDIELFTVTIHAIKSSLMTIGIDALSDKARELEYYGKEEDIEHINEYFFDFLAEYRGIKAVLLEAIK